MPTARREADPAVALWEQARSGDLRGAAAAARAALDDRQRVAARASRIELHLVAASCAMRQGRHAEALRDLDAAAALALGLATDSALALRVDVWRAELAYFQGRYSAANAIIDRALAPLVAAGALADAAFALRVRFAIRLAHADYEAVAREAARAIELAESSGDDYVLVQVLNILGATSFDRATSKLPEPHARAHLSALDLHDTAPMEADARDALRYFERAGEVARRAGYTFAAWYVAGNVERLEILLGHADHAVRAIRKRLKALQAIGASYDEIVTRSNLAWGLRVLGLHGEALHELDVALALARETGTANVLLEFLEYDRSIVLAALGDMAAARASYRDYLRLVNGWNAGQRVASGSDPPAAPKRPLEPYFLKSADRYIREHLAEAISVESLALHCEVSWRTLQTAFGEYRGVTPVAHIRNLRLDHARRMLGDSDAAVKDVAVRCGFRSATTFALEFRKRFGVRPSRVRRTVSAGADGAQAPRPASGSDARLAQAARATRP
jgi:AraC-like DNA-binding protein